MDRLYTVTIRASLDSRGLKAGERESISAFDRIAQNAERAAKREAAAFTSSAQARVNGELSVQRQLSAAASLQRQRSAALISQFKAQERAALQAATGVLPLRQALQNLSTIAATMQGPLGSIAGRISSLGSLSDQLTTSVRGAGGALAGLLPILGGVGAGLAALAVAGVGLFKLAKDTADFGAKLRDLSDQTGIGVAALSTLKVAAELSGGSIDSINTALARYLRSVSDANHGNELLEKKFRQVGFSVADLNTAYRSSDDAIRILLDRVGSLSSDQDRLNALQKVGVRNGTELNAVIKAMDGSFSDFQTRVRSMGLVIGPEQAAAADKFDDSLKLLTLQVKGMSYSIAREYLPQIGGAIADVSNSLTGNQNRWAAWGDFIKTELIGVRVAASGLAAFLQSLPAVGGHAGIAGIIGISAMVKKSRELHAPEVGVDASGLFSSRARRELGDATPRGGGGGGGRGTDPAVTARRLADLQLKAVVDGLRAEELAINRSLEKRGIDYAQYQASIQVLESTRHLAVMNGLEQERVAVTKLRDPSRKAIASMEVENKFLEERARHLQEEHRLIDKTLAQTREQIALVRTLAQHQAEADQLLLVSTRPRVALGETIFQRDKETSEAYSSILGDLNGQLSQYVQLTNIQRAAQALEAAGLTDLTDARAQEILALGQQLDQEEHLFTMRERVRAVASDISSVFADAVQDWSGSFGSFFRSVGQGFADMVKRMIAGVVHSNLTNIFQNLFGRIFGGGTPGFAGALTGGFSGGPGGGGFFGGGGITSPQGAQAAALANIFGGGISAPPSSTAPSLQKIIAAAQGDVTGGGIGGVGGGGFSLSGLASAAPLLGTGLGFGIGSSFGRGASPLASILGGVGLGAAGLVAGSALPSILAGSFAGLTALGAVTFGAGAALAVAAYIIGKNAQRRKEEQSRDAYSNQAGTAIWQLIDNARGMTLTQAQSVWSQIESQYKSQIATIRDSKTRRHAELQWQNDFAPLWSHVAQRVKEGEASKVFSSAFVPTFAQGAFFKSDFFVPRAAQGLMGIPGVFDRRDDLLMRVSRGEHVAVMTPDQFNRIGGSRTFQAAGVPALASGGVTNSTTHEPAPIQLTAVFEFDGDKIVAKGLRSSDNRKFIITEIRSNIDRERSEGLLGDIELGLRRR